jgi:hypothetical protein
MFIDDFNQLSEKEKETFRSVCNSLLLNTFIVRYDYKNGDYQHRNEYYTFLSQNENAVKEYLSYANWNLYKDDINGYFYIENINNTNKYTFSAEQTKLLLILRVIYENNLKEAGLTLAVTINVAEVLHQLIDVFALYDKKINMKDFKKNMNIIDGFNIIKAINGNYNETDCDFVILPTILTMVSADRINELVTELKNLEGETNEET